MENFIDKFGLIIYYIIMTFGFVSYYSFKYHINLSRIGVIGVRYDIPNRGKKFWIILVAAIIFMITVPTALFGKSWSYDWIRIISQIILVSMILYRYMVVGIFLGDLAVYLFDDIIYWTNISEYKWHFNKNTATLELISKDNKIKKIGFPSYLQNEIDTQIKKYLKIPNN